MTDLDVIATCDCAIFNDGDLCLPEEMARRWERPGMGQRPMLTLYVLARRARSAAVAILGLQIIGASYGDAPRPLVMGPIPRGMVSCKITRYGSGLTGVRHVVLYADRAGYEDARRRPGLPARLAALRWLDRAREGRWPS